MGAPATKKPIQKKFDHEALARELRRIPEPPKGGYLSPQVYRIKPGILGREPAFLVFGPGTKKLYEEMYNKLMPKKISGVIPKKYRIK